MDFRAFYDTHVRFVWRAHRNEASLRQARLDARLEASKSREAMRTAARDQGRPGSADAVAELLLALAERRALPDPATVVRIASAPMQAAPS